MTKQFTVKEIGIFGFVMRGGDKETGDVDLLVEFEEPKGFFKFLVLEASIHNVPEDREKQRMEVRR